MQESDRQLDDCIVRALRNEGSLTPQQKQRHWEQLQQRAARQTMLPPLDDEEAAPSLIERIRPAVEILLRSLHKFIFDESVYQRAREQFSWAELYIATGNSYALQQRVAFAIYPS